MTRSNDPLIGKQMGDYTIVSTIGQGGMARIYKGYDDKLERYAAIKIFDAQGVPQDELEEYRTRFMREARAIARLRHPNIVSVYQTGTYQGLNYMAMMFIEGRDLRQILKQQAANGSSLGRVEIVRIISDIASALDYAHREGVIHRDVKPSNIMITADGHAILTDFGLALSLPEGTIGTTFGSVHYIAPEQATSSALAVPQSDLYSLGVVLYEMLVGRVPFDDVSAMSVALKHLSEPPPPPRQLNPEIAPEVEIMVLKALDKDPQRRFQTGADFIMALESAFGMTDEDEMTRLLMSPEWQATIQRASGESAAPGPATDQPTVVYTPEDEKTISDASGTARPPLSQRRARPAAPARRNLLLAGALVRVVALMGILAAFGGGNLFGIAAVPTDTPTATMTPSATATSTATATPSPSPTPEPTEAPTETDSPPPAALPGDEADPTPEIADTTQEPAATTTAAPGPASASPTSAGSPPDEAQVQLVYDRSSLVLYNRSDTDVNVSGLLFVQRTAEGREISFQSIRWDGGSRPTSALPPGDCFQVWTFDDTLLEQPADCGLRHAWRQIGPLREFWRSDRPGATFEVRRGGVVLAECEIDAGVCDVDVRRR